jgi:hypothetical protein
MKSIIESTALGDSYKAKPKKSWPISAICVLICLSSDLPASVYVVVKSGTTLVVGADSRTTDEIDHSKMVRGGDRCKIIRCPLGSYFAISANPLENIKTGISFSRIAMKACSISGNMHIVATRFEGDAISAARTIFEAEKRGVVVSVTFFVSSVGGASFSARSIRYTGKERPHRDAPIDCANGCNNWVAGGIHDTINATLVDPSFFTRYGLVSGVRKLLMDQISADKTGEVGLPLSIIHLDGPSAIWEDSGVCSKDNAGKNR